MPRITARLVALCIAGIMVLSSVGADAGPDAGTGQDAGGTRDTALRIPGLGEYGAVASPKEDDWFRVDLGADNARCVRATTLAPLQGHVMLSVATSERTSTIKDHLTGGEGALGLASPSALSVWSGLKRTGSSTDTVAYGFELSAIGMPDPLDPDSFTSLDAGSTVGTAASVTDPCFGGSVGESLNLKDRADTYAVGAAVDDVVYYSLAAGAGVTMTALDAAGNVIGPVIESGGVAGVTVPEGGLYVQMSSSSPSTTYLSGLSFGPDPGSSCRPMCLL